MGNYTLLITLFVITSGYAEVTEDQINILKRELIDAFTQEMSKLSQDLDKVNVKVGQLETSVTTIGWQINDIHSDASNTHAKVDELIMPEMTKIINHVDSKTISIIDSVDTQMNILIKNISRNMKEQNDIMKQQFQVVNDTLGSLE